MASTHGEIAVHNSLLASLVEVHKFENVEFVDIRLIFNSFCLFISCSYILPSLDISFYVERLRLIGDIRWKLRTDDKLVVLGHFNLLDLVSHNEIISRIESFICPGDNRYPTLLLIYNTSFNVRSMNHSSSNIVFNTTSNCRKINCDMFKHLKSMQYEGSEEQFDGNYQLFCGLL